MNAIRILTGVTCALAMFGRAAAQANVNVDDVQVGEVLFTSAQAGNFDIFAMNPDTSDQRALTDSDGNDTSPSWSPDGLYVLFISDRTGNAEVFMMSSDGTNQRPLTDTAADEVAAAWSPDGAQIVFVRGDSDVSPLAGGTAQLFILTLATGEERQLTNADALHNAPAWSPDGEWIAYVSDAEGSPQLYKMRVDGSDILRLTHAPGTSSFNPAWSPDGTTLAFDSIFAGNRDVYTMDSDGSNVLRLTRHIAIDMQPVWTFDGLRLMFVSERTGGIDIYRMFANGGNVERLTTGDGIEAEPFCLWAGA